ncbi:MAG: hypothetical protein CM15mP87_00260 [Candidatus Neomarinimicrobiota bacterium]|nr:MAG: hypothetical protein CM15mP87_00260 [Candidatus Neomarinimicrobiota bacterium]
MNLENALYVLSSVLFIFGIKRLSHPKTARSGNFIASMGMLIAIITTLIANGNISLELVGLGILIGSIIGAFFCNTCGNDTNAPNGCYFQWLWWNSLSSNRLC